jgi:hypothetical protein
MSNFISPEQDKDGVWFIVLPDGRRKEFKSNSEAWSWLDRQERGHFRRQSRWREPLSYALSKAST